VSDLAIEWGSDRIVLLQGKASGEHVNARSAAVLEWPEGIDPNTAPQRAGEWLKGELASRGFSAKPALVSLPRESVVVRPLELPNVPDDEVPDMVRLQAATKVTMGADQYLLDFIPLPPRGAETRDVLMTTVPTEVTQAITATLSAAGVEIAAIGVSSFNTGELVHHQMDAKTKAASQLHLSVIKAGARVEVALLRGSCTLAASSTRVGSATDPNKAISAEINRLRLSAQQLHGGLPISHVWVSPADADGQMLAQFLKDKLNAEVTNFDPLGGTGSIDQADRGYFATVAGHLLSFGGSQTESVNFLSPRKAAAKKDARRLKMIVAGGGLALLLVTAWWMVRQRVASIEEEAQFIADSAAEIDAAVSKASAEIASADLMNEWQNSRVSWLDEMEKMNDQLPGRDRALVGKYVLTSASGNKQAAVYMEGIARSRVEVNDFSDTLEASGYSVNPPEAESGGSDEYEMEFKLKADLPTPGDSDKKSKK